MEGHPLVITGMHRSGTSLATRLLQTVGLAVGDELLGPHQSNPFGHFEDVGILDLHREVLHRCGYAMLSGEDVPHPEMSEFERAWAQRLVAERSGRGAWGFKDPRTVLFLDAWERFLPAARFLFVYRSPLEVALSLMKRGSDLEVLTDPSAGLRAWVSYNRRILAFHRRRRSDALLVHVHAVAARPADFVDLVKDKLAMPLARLQDAALVDRSVLLHLPRSERLQALERSAWPEALELYTDLEAAADLASPPAEELTDGQDACADLAPVVACARMLGRHAEARDEQAGVVLRILALIFVRAAASVSRRLTELHERQEGRVHELERHVEERIAELTAHADNLVGEVERRDRRIAELEDQAVELRLRMDAE